MQHTPFNGDHFIGQEIRALCARFNIETIIETGTWSGHSTREFLRIVPRVITIDATHEHLLEEFGKDAVRDLEELGADVILGDSSQILAPILRMKKERRDIHPVLLYLDAHGGGAGGSNVNPLLEELDIIGQSRGCRDRCVIAIHDFLVPGKPWGYNGGDWGRGFEPLSYELIATRLERIYPGGHSHHYNEEAAGVQRGIIYIHPGA